MRLPINITRAELVEAVRARLPEHLRAVWMQRAEELASHEHAFRMTREAAQALIGESIVPGPFKPRDLVPPGITVDGRGEFRAIARLGTDEDIARLLEAGDRK